MNPKALTFMAFLCLFLLFSLPAAADDLADQDTFRCHKGIVETGDTEYQVQEKCGKPTAKTEYETVWVYDRGPSNFVYYIKFDDGKVFRIQSGGYGK